MPVCMSVIFTDPNGFTLYAFLPVVRYPFTFVSLCFCLFVCLPVCPSVCVCQSVRFSPLYEECLSVSQCSSLLDYSSSCPSVGRSTALWICRLCKPSVHPSV